MKFELTILGCNGAVPLKGKYPSCQFLTIDNFHFLIDCGEGAQFQMINLNIPKHRIDQIFITHLHGDHVFGLAGLITSYLLAGRTKKLEIFAPTGIEHFITTQLFINGHYEMSYPLVFHEIDTTKSTLIFENDKVEVINIPLQHRVPTCGYLFREKQRVPNIDKNKLTEFELDRQEILKLKAGESVTNKHGKSIQPEDVLLPFAPRRSFAYCSDTMYAPEIVPLIKDVDLLYHEATFSHADLEVAQKTHHSTAVQAAQIASDAGVGSLLLGHFSARYTDRQRVADEAREIFPDTLVAEEGIVIEICLENNLPVIIVRN